MKAKVTKKKLCAAETARAASCEKYMSGPESADDSEKDRLRELLAPHKLTPIYHGRERMGNSEWSGYEC